MKLGSEPLFIIKGRRLALQADALQRRRYINGLLDCTVNNPNHPVGVLAVVRYLRLRYVCGVQIALYRNPMLDYPLT